MGESFNRTIFYTYANRLVDCNEELSHNNMFPASDRKQPSQQAQLLRLKLPIGSSLSLVLDFNQIVRVVCHYKIANCILLVACPSRGNSVSLVTLKLVVVRRALVAEC